MTPATEESVAVITTWNATLSFFIAKRRMGFPGDHTGLPTPSARAVVSASSLIFSPSSIAQTRGAAIAERDTRRTIATVNALRLMTAQSYV